MRARLLSGPQHSRHFGISLRCQRSIRAADLPRLERAHLHLGYDDGRDTMGIVESKGGVEYFRAKPKTNCRGMSSLRAHSGGKRLLKAANVLARGSVS